MKIVLFILGALIIAYMLRLEHMHPLDRPLFWGEITMTFGVFFGIALLIIAKWII